MAETDRGRSLAQELAVVALVATAALPMTRLFSSGLGPVVALSLTLSVVLSGTMRRLGVSPISTWGLSMLALIWFVGVRFFPETLVGPIPGTETVRTIGEAVRAGATQLVEEVAPVAPTEPLLMFAAAGVWITTWLVDATVMYLKNPFLAVFGAIALFAVPGAVVTSSRLGVEVALFLAAAAVLVYLDQRETMIAQGAAGADEVAAWGPPAALRVGVVAIAVAALAAPAIPGFGAIPGFRGSGSGSQVYFNPIVAIRPSLDDDREIELLRVQSSSPSYIRLTSLDVFDGGIWREREDRPRIDLRASTAPVQGTTKRVRQRIIISNLAGPWLPAPYLPVYVSGQSPMMELDDNTLLVDGRLHPGMEYVVESDVPAPTRAELDRPFEYPRSTYAPYLDLPRVPEQVAAIARDLTRDATTPFQAVLALQTELRTFAYDENVALGHDFGDMVTFLTEVRAGYCEQFAGTMAVMARTLGIPARVAIGFGNGTRIAPGVTSISTRQAHAWVEVFFPGTGWVIFEPTPRAGVATLPGYTPPPAATPVEPDPAESERPDPQPSASERPDPEEQSEQGPGFVANDGWNPVPVVTLVVALGAALAAGPATAALRRRRRLARATTSRQVASIHYADFLEWAAAAGVGRDPSETPREHAARVARLASEAADPAERLAYAIEQALWSAEASGGDRAVSEAVAASAALKQALAPTLTRTSRIRGSLRWGPWAGFPERRRSR